LATGRGRGANGNTPALQAGVGGSIPPASIEPGTYAMAFRLSVDGHPIQGVDHLRLDEEGLIRRITVSMRPLRALQVLAERMADTVASLT
jgi:hypothetical protein